MRDQIYNDNNSQQTFRDTTSSPSYGYGEILREIIDSTKDLVSSELALVTAEMKHVAKATSRDLSKVVAFGTLAVLSLLPFIAFLVIGLGELLDHRYWLSSLIVAVVFAAVGGFFAYRSLKKVTDQDLDFSATKNSLRRDKYVIQSNVERVKTAVKGDSNGTVQLH